MGWVYDHSHERASDPSSRASKSFSSSARGRIGYIPSHAARQYGQDLYRLGPLGEYAYSAQWFGPLDYDQRFGGEGGLGNLPLPDHRWARRQSSRETGGYSLERRAL